MTLRNYKELDALMGSDEETIVHYFGKPTLSLNSILLYKKEFGTLAIVFKVQKIENNNKNIVAGFVLYSSASEVLHIRGVRLLDTKTIEEAHIGSTFTGKKDILGEPTADIGSGCIIYAYFTNDARLLTFRGTPKTSGEIVLLKLTGKDAGI